MSNYRSFENYFKSNHYQKILYFSKIYMNKIYGFIFLLIVLSIFICIYIYIHESYYKPIPTTYMYNNPKSCNLSIYYNLNSTKSSKTLIFTLIINIKENDYKNFFKSLEKVQYNSNILIITDKISKIWNSSHFNINYIVLEKSYPYYPYNHPIYPIKIEILKKYIPNYFMKMRKLYFYNIVRYLIFSIFLKFYGINYEYFLLTDARDVIFQTHPFKWSICPGVYLVEEAKIRTLKNIYPKFNRQYFKNKTELNRYVINGGIIFGSSKEITMFFCNLTRLYIKYGFAGNDQSFLNYFYYILHPFNYPVILNEDFSGYAKCIAQDLANSNNDLIDDSGYIINKDGSIPAVIHQYNVGIDSKNKIRRIKYKKYLEMMT